MRLYLDAASKNNIGYTPDWIQVTYDENGNKYELTLDIQGEIDYDPTCLSCRCKGDLIPWTLVNLDTGDETDLSELSEEEIEENYPNEKLLEIFTKGDDYLVGIYPVDDANYEDNDCLKNGIGTVELYLPETDTICQRRFEFDTEVTG